MGMSQERAGMLASVDWLALRRGALGFGRLVAPDNLRFEPGAGLACDNLVELELGVVCNAPPCCVDLVFDDTIVENGRVLIVKVISGAGGGTLLWGEV